MPVPFPVINKCPVSRAGPVQAPCECIWVPFWLRETHIPIPGGLAEDPAGYRVCTVAVRGICLCSLGLFTLGVFSELASGRKGAKVRETEIHFRCCVVLGVVPVWPPLPR